MATKKLGLPQAADLDLFSSEKQRGGEGAIREIQLSKIDDFKNHPFKVIDDEDMEMLVESIKENGIIVPAIVRVKKDGRYEMISGHRRKRACEIAGLKTLKCEVRELDDSEAAIMMVDANRQRTKLLPSELAYAYKIRLDATKFKAGRKSAGDDSESGRRSVDELADEAGISREKIRRYVRLTELVPQLLLFVDEGKITVGAGVELSYLNESQQRMVSYALEQGAKYPAVPVAQKLRALGETNELGLTQVEQILGGKKANAAKAKASYTIKTKSIKKYLPSEITSQKDVQEYIIKALEYYSQKHD